MNKLFFRWQLVLLDVVILLAALLLLFWVGHYARPVTLVGPGLLTLICLLSVRIGFGVYRQIWRYGGVQCYVRLLAADAAAFILNSALALALARPLPRMPFSYLVAVYCMDTLGVLSIRLLYRYAYHCCSSQTAYGRFWGLMLRIFVGARIKSGQDALLPRIRIAIIGAGRTGVALAGELLTNPAAQYEPRCFVDVNPSKAGRRILNLPVLDENDDVLHQLAVREVQELVLAIPDLPEADKKRIFDFYTAAGCKLKVYDYPLMQTAGGKRALRDFAIEELLCRQPIALPKDTTAAYYAGSTVLISGGGGSIGSELVRQLAEMRPKRIIIFDIAENGAYDVQQELRQTHPELPVCIEIGSITDREALARVFQRYRPGVVLHAAAHKHVPLMEDNCIEAIRNNVFGTQNLIDLAEEFGVERFIMISSDKAVNPTSVMGATKRLCEMLVQCASQSGRVKYSATRFGNVLGSAGSVIPLFKRQIASGGPITVTDRRIIRYFMTIAEASQLVLQAGAMAQNGELFVFDMGQPIRIWELAENMRRLSGAPDIDIIETGLRPGEKLYEELLVRTEELDKTENSLIFIERDQALPQEVIAASLALLEQACASGDNEAAREALREAVPTYRRADEVNAEAEALHRLQPKLSRQWLSA